MAEKYHPVTVRGVTITGYTVMEARRDGYCDETRQRFAAGCTILYKSGRSLTDEEADGLGGKSRQYGVTAIWDLVKNNLPDEAWSDCSDEERRLEMEADARRPAPPPKKKSLKDFEPSEYQLKIADVLFKKGVNILISALAGCGKTATLVWLIWGLAKKGFLAGREVYFLAFNANIRDEVTPDLEGSGVTALTTHQFCLRKVLGYKINKKEKTKGERNRRVFLKVVMDLSEAQDEWAAKKTGYWGYRKTVLKLVPLVKNWAIMPEFDGTGWVFDESKRTQITNLIALYKLDPKDELDPETMVQLACAVISYSLPAPGIEPAEYDFDDMLYHVLVLNLPIPQVDLVFVDEVQDLNAAQIRILARMEQNGTRIVAVGDKNQAIYMFRGADARAWDRLIGMLQASRRGLEVMELPINYRSLPAILDYARMLVPGLVGFRQGTGVVSHETAFDDMMDFFRQESMQRVRRTMAVICRNRAPLVQAGYASIAQGHTVCFLGKGDLTKPLHDMIDAVAGYSDRSDRCNRITDRRDDRDGSIAERGFLTRLGEHVRSEKAKYEGQEDMADFLEELADTAECLRVIAGAVQDDKVDSIRREIDSRFVDKPIPGSITFTTVHGAKGLQWKVVFGIRKDLLPSPRVQQYDADGNITDEYQQELNLDYIWRTRGEDECHIVCTWPFGKGMGDVLDQLPQHDVEERENFWAMGTENASPSYDDRLFEVPEATMGRSAPMPYDAPASPPSNWGVKRKEGVYPTPASDNPVRKPAPASRQAVKRFVDDGQPF